MPYLASYGMRGDPGLFGFLGRTIKGAVGGFLGGGPLGAITGGVRGAVGAPRAPAPMRGFAGFSGTPNLPAVRPSVAPATTGGLPPRGYKLNKSGYFLKSGEYVAPGTRFVKVRRRNPANAKALRKALSRAESFGGLVKRARATTRKLKTI